MNNYIFSGSVEDLDWAIGELTFLQRIFRAKPPKSTIIFFNLPIEQVRMLCFENEIRILKIVGRNSKCMGAFDIRATCKLVVRLGHLNAL